METPYGVSMFTVYSSCLLLLVVVAVSWKALNWVWFRPKKLEKRLKEQGFRGNPYKLLHGDFKEMSTLYTEAQSKNLNLSDDIVPRVIPQYLGAIKKYGMFLSPLLHHLNIHPSTSYDFFSPFFFLRKIKSRFCSSTPCTRFMTQYRLEKKKRIFVTISFLFFLVTL